MEKKMSIEQIKDRVRSITGLQYEEYCTPSRRKIYFYARMIFAYYSWCTDMRVVEIGKLLNRSHCSICYYLKKYYDEIKYNPEFRQLNMSKTDVDNEKMKVTA